MKITQIENWGLGISPQKPLVISGPCSAETADQVLQSCLGAAKHGISILRAGIWKPRTRPDSFEGVGAPGLAWIKSASLETGLPVCTEVATPRHVEKALEAGKVRTEEPLILKIDGKTAKKDGMKIYHAGKDVYITDGIDAKYISKVKDSEIEKTGKRYGHDEGPGQACIKTGFRYHGFTQ